MYTNFTKKIFISVLFLFSVVSISYASIMGYTTPGWYAGYLSGGNTQLYGPFGTQAECSYQYSGSGYIPCTYYETAPNNTVPDTTPPVVQLVSPTPADGATLSIGAQVVLKATATDNVGIHNVKFYISGTTNPIGTDHHSPYTAENWTPSTAGNYTITAMATDEAGNTAISYGRNITVVNGGGQQGTNPSVVLNGIQDNQQVTLPSNGFSLIAIPTNIPSPSVVFYQNDTAIGTALTSPPYMRTWIPTVNGTYTLKATASNAAGVSATSPIKTIIVGPGNNNQGDNGNTNGVVISGQDGLTLSNIGHTVSGTTVDIHGTFSPATHASLANGTGIYLEKINNPSIHFEHTNILTPNGVFSAPFTEIPNGTYKYIIRPMLNSLNMFTHPSLVFTIGDGGQTIPPQTTNGITVSNVSITISGQTATISGKITPANSQSLTLSLYSDAAHTTPINSYPFTLNNSGSFSVPTSTLASGTYYFTIRVN